VRILLDQNLSPKLIRSLADVIPGLETVYDHDLIGASDPLVFDWARTSEFTAVVSTDLDFVRLVERMGQPPKVIRIERCDFPAKVIEQLLRREALWIHDFWNQIEPCCCGGSNSSPYITGPMRHGTNS
jgi:predicted nuclease of predicted toxin-antitoxin system